MPRKLQRITARTVLILATLAVFALVALPALASTASGTATCHGDGSTGVTRGTAVNWQEHRWEGRDPQVFTYYGEETRTAYWYQLTAGTYNWEIEGPELSDANGWCGS